MDFAYREGILATRISFTFALLAKDIFASRATLGCWDGSDCRSFMKTKASRDNHEIAFDDNKAAVDRSWRGPDRCASDRLKCVRPDGQRCFVRPGLEARRPGRLDPFPGRASEVPRLLQRPPHRPSGAGGLAARRSRSGLGIL